MHEPSLNVTSLHVCVCVDVSSVLTLRVFRVCVQYVLHLISPSRKKNFMRLLVIGGGSHQRTSLDSAIFIIGAAASAAAAALPADFEKQLVIKEAEEESAYIEKRLASIPIIAAQVAEALESNKNKLIQLQKKHSIDQLRSKSDIKFLNPRLASCWDGIKLLTVKANHIEVSLPKEDIRSFGLAHKEHNRYFHSSSGFMSKLKRANETSHDNKN
eukprot:Blabericola_migrator_1__400@NODE_10_length_25093_cov_104_131184_g7_i2_p14_GENE_NODE_10_length_25093_cov_104_131184_g7_i2NODE_10_length_25093_cov_104_131184_g7_i2_p14_ORF_typecomplete_len214_score34_66_NODE_10_length_25093_cov_104_131184_g7_i2215856